MLGVLSKNWWIFLIRGAAAILFGIAVFIFPGAALAAIVALVAAYLLVDGVFTVIYAVQHRSQSRWWVVLLEGFISIIGGIAAIVYPTITPFVLLYIVAFWALLTGLMEIIFAIEMRKQIENEWWIILSGVLSIIFGVLLILFPGDGIVTLLWLVGAYAIIFGIFMVIFAFRVKGMAPGTGERAPSAG
jgi:uncharacterized membrane protein HdeD (DUF308 family)